MQISVIVPGYEDLAGVLTALNSLRGLAAGPVEYIVQDDASPSLNLVALVPPEIASTVRNETNLGFAGNCNAGAARATGDILFFVNQDVYGVRGLSEGWDRALAAAFDLLDAGIVGARLLFPDGRVQNAGGLFDARRQPFHRCLGYADPNGPETVAPARVRWTTGAALAIRRGLFEALGGFDTGYRMYFEDVDLCLRAAAAGQSIWYTPGVTLAHRVGSTGGSPHFAASARRFAQTWAHRIEPDVPAVKVALW